MNLGFGHRSVTSIRKNARPAGGLGHGGLQRICGSLAGSSGTAQYAVDPPPEEPMITRVGPLLIVGILMAPAFGEDAGEGSKERADWISKRIEQVVKAGEAERKAAIDALIENDKEGDCITPLIALLEEHKKDTALVVALVRGLGRDGLASAALAIAERLGHRDESVRGKAAVSLEYIGSPGR